MPRQLSFTVCPYPDYRDGRRYRARVVRVAKSTKPSGLAVRLEHLNSDQEGRLLDIVLPLPRWPEGITAGLFRECGLDVVVGEQLVARDLVGAVVIARISCMPGKGVSVVAFEPAKEDTK